MTIAKQVAILEEQVQFLQHDVHVLVEALKTVWALSPMDFGKCKGEEAPLVAMQRVLERIKG